MCQQRDEVEPLYTPIQAAAADLSDTSLEMAAVMGGLPAFYTLNVGTNLRVFAAQLARKLNATQLGNPLCPYINVVVREDLAGGEWYLETPKGRFGSAGYL